LVAATESLRKSVFNPLGAALILLAAVVLGIAVVAFGEYALYGLFGVMGFAVFLRYPIAGVFVTTLLLLLVSGAAGVLGSLQAPVPVTYSKISGFATLAAYVVNLLVTGKPIKMRAFEGILLLFFGWAFFGVMASENWQAQFPEWIRLATLVVFFIIAAQLIHDRIILRRYIILLAVCGFVMSIFAVLQYFIPAFHYTPEELREIGRGAAQGAYVDPESLSFGAAVRVSGTSGHSNWLAFALLLLIPLNVYWWYVSKSWWGKSFAILATLLDITALVLTFTRTGFIVGMAVLVLLSFRGLVRINPYRLAAVGVLAIFAWLVLPEAYKERVLDFTGYAESTSVGHRAQLMTEAFEVAAQNPLLGVGIGGYGFKLIEENTDVAVISRWLVDEHGWNPAYLGTHNMYLQLASEMGLIGLFLFLLFMYVIMRRLLYAERIFRERGDEEMQVLTASVIVSLFSFLISALFLHALQQKIWWMIVAAAAVVPLVAVHAQTAVNGTPRTRP